MEIKNKSKVKIGVVPTHLMFVGALAPDESGKLPRTRSGDLKIVSGMRLLCRTSPVKLNTVQVTLFPGADPKDLQDMFRGLKALKLEVHLIMMVGGANPLNPKDEDADARRKQHDRGLRAGYHRRQRRRRRKCGLGRRLQQSGPVPREQPAGRDGPV